MWTRNTANQGVTMSEYQYCKSSVLQILKQPLSNTEYRKLEKNLINNGCSEPLLVWDKYVIDGVKRYEICKTYGISYTTKHKNFREMIDAVSYICEVQLERDDLTVEMRKYLIGRKYLADVEICVREFVLNPPAEYLKTHLSLPKKPNKKYEVGRIVGKKYNLATGTVLKYGYFASNIDELREKDAELAERILSSKLKISHENLIEFVRLPTEDVLSIKKIMDEHNMDHIGYSDIRHELQWKYFHEAKPKEPKAQKVIPEIRKLPEYDPDAEASSLSLTIPSWVSSINRMKKNTVFENITPPARKKLQEQLIRLMSEANNLYQALEEKKDVGN